MRGVGRGSQQCIYKVDLVGALHTGELISYQAPVLDEDPSDASGDGVPPLWSLSQMAQMNGLVNSRTGEIVCLPEGEQPTWPAGTKILQMERAPGGHWLLRVDHWSRVPREKLEQVRQLRRSQSVQ